MGDAAVNADDDGAIAPDKTALRAGALAALPNYSNYSRGINGIMIDLANATGAITASDFEFKVGNSTDPSTWTDAPAHTGFDIRLGEGEGESDRITFTWADGAIKNQWLQVTVKANGNTGLGTPDVHYWGNQVGETGNDATTAVNAGDVGEVINNATAFLPASITNPFDLNHDGAVNAGDLGVVINNATAFTSLALFNSPAPTPLPLAGSSAPPPAVAPSTAAEESPVQPVRPEATAEGRESFSVLAFRARGADEPKKTPDPVLQTVTPESAATQSAPSVDPVVETESGSDDLWIAPPGEITLGSFFPRRSKK